MGQNVTLVKQFGNPTFTSLITDENTTVGGNLSVLGTATISGSLTAQSLIVVTTNVITGSTIFGSVPTNTHQFTGSIFNTVSISTAGSFTGSGAGLTSIPNSALTNRTISGIALGSNLATLTIGTGLSGTSYNGSTGVTIANTITNTNQLTNGAGFITSAGTAAAVNQTVTGTNSAELVRGNMADNDQFRILIGGTSSNAGYVEIATADDGTEPIYVRQYTGVFSSLTRTATLLDGSGNTTFPGDVTAYSSDERLKENVQNIPNALYKVLSLNGVTFDWKQEAFDAGFNPKIKKGDAGVLAQQVQAVLPQAVKPAPFDIDENGSSISGKDYLTVQYEKLAPLFIEAIKEQQSQIEKLKTIINGLTK
jgi:hypothetical protein